MIKKIKEIFLEAHFEINKQDAAKELLKLGQMRAGSSGALKDDKAYYAQCGRLAQARLLGKQTPPTPDMRVMFEAGLALENYIEKQLIARNIEFKKEETVVGNVGTHSVSGRPDFEINLDGSWVGVEVKSLASPFSVIKQVKNKFPMTKHMIQAATYMLLTNRDYWLIVVGNVFYARERGFSVNPGLRWYEMRKSPKAGVFTIYNEEGETMTLPFDQSDIERYYNALEDATKTETLMPRPTEYELNMSTYNRCDYCPNQSACNAYDNEQLSFKDWMAQIK